MKHTELIERLRAGSGGMKHWQELESEAADAIEALQSTLARIEKKVDALIAERDALKLDAERYRHCFSEGDFGVCRYEQDTQWDDGGWVWLAKDEADNWIDTAMKGAA